MVVVVGREGMGALSLTQLFFQLHADFFLPHTWDRLSIFFIHFFIGSRAVVEERPFYNLHDDQSIGDIGLQPARGSKTAEGDTLLFN